MKHILEYNDFINSLDFAEVTSGKNSRSIPLSEDKFVEIFNTKCKNYNFNNTQLYRGVILKHDTDFFYINPTDERGSSDHMKKLIKGTNYNTKLREDPQFSDLPNREHCLIGSTNPKAAMITVGNTLSKIQEDRAFIIIPFDNIEIAVAPILDLQGFRRIRPVDDMRRDDFLLKKYTKEFIIPGTPKGFNDEGVTRLNSKEIWTEGECLLVRYSSLPRLKELVEQRS